jgi:uncharacterized protein YggE
VRLAGWTVAALSLLSISIMSNATAQTPLQPRLLTVIGEGEVKAKPDQAMLSAGVVTQGKTAAAALAANTRAMNAVFDTLKRLDIPERSIRTSDISVQPQYSNDSHQPQRIVGYQVSNTVTVTVDDLGRLGPTLDALVSSGANAMGDIIFNLRDPKPLQAQAREAGMKDAISRAGTLARAAGVVLGPIVQISEGGNSALPVPIGRRIAAAASLEATPVAPGEATVQANVSVTWEIR